TGCGDAGHAAGSAGQGAGARGAGGGGAGGVAGVMRPWMGARLAGRWPARRSLTRLASQASQKRAGALFWQSGTVLWLFALDVRIRKSRGCPRLFRIRVFGGTKQERSCLMVKNGLLPVFDSPDSQGE